MDDAAILRDIARRIRDGIDRSGAAGPQPAPVLDAPPDDADAREHALLAKLAHELKSPLGAIVAAAEMMAHERLGPMTNPQYLGYAADIATSGRHALTLIDRILRDWRQPGPAAPLDFVQLDLNALVERTASVLRPLVRERGQTIRTDLAERLPNLIADATSLRQILVNVLSNSAKYAAAGTEIILATSFVLDGPVVLEISDKGPGMSPDQLAVALGKAPANAARGTGLGLALVRDLAAANGATVAIASPPGEGTTLRLTFAKDKVVPV